MSSAKMFTQHAKHYWTFFFFFFGGGREGGGGGGGGGRSSNQIHVDIQQQKIGFLFQMVYMFFHYVTIYP